MDLVDVVYIYIGYILYSYSFKARKGNSLLTYLVNYYKGYIVAVFVL